jgi:transcriptional regulator with XRE-family HTH domain
MADDLEEARRRRERQRTAQPVGAFSPSLRRRQAINRTLAKVEAAAERRDPAAYYAGKTPVPERITTALNLCMLYGPEVDQALDGEEPMVDEWESGDRVPSLTQIQALAALTGYSVRFFYEPAPPPITQGWMCGSDGCRPLGDGDG